MQVEAVTGGSATTRVLIAIVLAVVVLGAAFAASFHLTPVDPLLAFAPGKAPLRLMRIAPGNFLMGSNNGDDDELPVHRVRITHAFFMGVTEVTVEQYYSLMGENPSSLEYDAPPVERVSWNDATDYCRMLTEEERKKGNLPEDMEYRLPTEAEWEYCCRAGSTSEYCFGDDASRLGDYDAWFGLYRRNDPAHRVGAKKPNAWGLYDMHGSVWEWCRDWYAPYSKEPGEDPAGPMQGEKRVVRGGSSLEKAYYCRSSNRSWCDPSYTHFRIGFRVVAAVSSNAEEERRKRGAMPEWQREAPLKLVSVAPGTFRMGSEKGGDSEKPVHVVTITSAFYIGATEVSQAQYREVMGDNPSYYVGARLPVGSVTWVDAMDFCRRLTESEGKAGRLPPGMIYRLPTEAEWEYCCRAGSAEEYCFTSGESSAARILRDYAWFGRNGRMPQVGKKAPNAWGIYDMHGNVWEWCYDWYSPYAPDARKQTNPAGPSAGVCRVVRGGSAYKDASCCRSAFRAMDYPDRWSKDIGFRVVLGTPIVRPPVQPMDRSTIEKAPLKLAAISPGTFMMGSEKGEDNEKPVHRVNISRPFYMAATEVTQGQYMAVMKTNPSVRSGGDDLPVDSVAWLDAMEFCRKLTDQERLKGNIPDDLTFRLPTEAEWEYCCRAGSTSEYCYGGDPSLLGDYASFVRSTEYGGGPVGGRKPNAWGLYDMHGSVWEWCLGWYAEKYPSGEAILTDPGGPPRGEYRVTRGGSLYSDAGACRCASRETELPDHASFVLGFRVVLAPEALATGEEGR